MKVVRYVWPVLWLCWSILNDLWCSVLWFLARTTGYSLYICTESRFCSYLLQITQVYGFYDECLRKWVHSHSCSVQSYIILWSCVLVEYWRIDPCSKLLLLRSWCDIRTSQRYFLWKNIDCMLNWLKDCQRIYFLLLSSGWVSHLSWFFICMGDYDFRCQMAVPLRHEISGISSSFVQFWWCSEDLAISKYKLIM